MSGKPSLLVPPRVNGAFRGAAAEAAEEKEDLEAMRRKVASLEGQNGRLSLQVLFPPRARVLACLGAVRAVARRPHSCEDWLRCCTLVGGVDAAPCLRLFARPLPHSCVCLRALVDASTDASAVVV